MKKVLLGVLAPLAIFLSIPLVAQVVTNPAGPPTFIGCAYNSAPPAPTSGQGYWVQCDSNGALLTASSGSSSSSVVGNVASGATDSGAPVKVGGKYNSTKPTFTDGQRGDVQIGTRGSIITQQALPDSASAVTSFTAGADATSNTFNTYSAYNFNNIFNGTTWDRRRSSIDATNSTGTGIAAAGLVAQRDDASPTAITENQFGNVRIDSSRAILVNSTPQKKSYRVVQALLAPTAAGTMVELQGSGTTTVKITRIKFTGKLTTGERGRIRVFRATAAETSGTTTTAGTIIQMDSAQPSSSAATAVLKAWTTAGTPGAATSLEDTYVFVPATTAAGETFEVIFNSAQPLTIRGTSEFLVVGSTFSSYTGANFNIILEWTEE